ncbi:MAG: type I methionyl aminopeptidase [Bacteroidota bacterium]|nr:type I methionyl aminopeptidase [Bacteroidota bacterium]
MIYIKTKEEVELLRESSLLVGKTLAEVAKIIKPGVSCYELDKVAETFIRDNDAKPAFKDYNGFPSTLCVSLNSEVVHGFPLKNKILKEGDIVSVDCGTVKNGFYGDSAYTFPVGQVSEEIKIFLQRIKKSLYLGIESAVEGKRIGDIGFEIQNYCESFGYSVVREMVGHGVGRNLHEKPDVPNYGRRGQGHKLIAGMVIAIEPMINIGKKEVYIGNDGWCVLTRDGKPSAHFEHTIAITNGKADILSSFEYLEKLGY